MAGFILGNTLSDNGAVTRGVCKVNGEGGCLTGVDETSGIVKTASGAAVQKDGVQTPIDAGSHVSMNMWGLTPEFIDRLEAGFKGFPRRPQRGGRQERVPPPHRHRRDDRVGGGDRQGAGNLG